MGVHEITDLLESEGRVFQSIKVLLENMQESAKKKDGDAVLKLTAQLTSEYEAASGIDKKISEAAAQEAEKLGIPIAEFKLAMMKGGAHFPAQIDKLREQLREVAMLAARTGGVLSANIDIIEDTVRVLESLDARASGYGPEKPAGRPSKIIDRTA